MGNIVCNDSQGAGEDRTGGKPGVLGTMASAWTSQWTLRLTPEQMAELGEEERSATLAMRELIGRRSVAYPMPVGKYSVTKSKDWRPRHTDVIILTFHKTGTTWCQQICHQLRLTGHTDFPEITQVMPWIDFAWEINQDLNQDQVAFPRLFKSHARLSAVQEGCRYLVTIRDPKATLISLYKFMLQKNAAVPFLPKPWLENVDAFARCPIWMVDSIWGGNYWEYMREFWLCRKQPTVHLVAFEHMKQDLRRELPAISEFLGLTSSDAVLDEVVRLSSLDWMMEHEDKFNEGWFREQQMFYGRFDREPLPPVSKVTFGHKFEPTEETVALLQEQWDLYIGSTIDVADYETMLAQLTEEKGY